MKGIIYYTSHNAKPELLKGVQKQLLSIGLPITSVSLEPLDFGNNIVYGDPNLRANQKRGIMSYINQIILALENAKEKYVFFCEHDVLYHPSHFEFTPPRDDTFYYNRNVWRWDYISKRTVSYDQVASVSGICVNREFALDFYKNRLKIILENGWDKIPTFGNPQWARDLGYEPGRRNNQYEPKVRSEEWRSEYPIIDVKHTRCITHGRWEIDKFKNKPTNWKEDIIDNIPGWENVWNLVS